MNMPSQNRQPSAAVIQAKALTLEQNERLDGLLADALPRWTAACEPAGQAFDPGLSWPLGKVFL